MYFDLMFYDFGKFSNYKFHMTLSVQKYQRHQIKRKFAVFIMVLTEAKYDSETTNHQNVYFHLTLKQHGVAIYYYTPMMIYL